MKKALLILIALISIEAIAQQRMERPDRKEMAQNMSALTPEESAELQTKRMTLRLDLNQSQQQEIYKINLENANKRKDMMTARKAKRASGDMERPSKEELLKMTNERLDHQIATKAKMKLLLDAEQYTKWEKGQSEMTNGFKKGMKNKKRFSQDRTSLNKKRF
ncbi:hypothetical protein [Confluentibacter flavum]|uniref:DUF4890 domain-containing protein n=1 Tax=Confluentibacter flavum TaxID=1909700 RepID=A0A2N3HJQ4_9FLAO|nr:hypothetical protein [Confluentibacter flavum]PKQ45209.1 hypothetical protein CSW08_09340 [Confluentibacter flavum]